jgi:glucokinase
MKSQAPSEAKPALGIDIGGTKVRAALVGEGGDVLQAAERPTRGAGQGAGRVIEGIARLARRCLTQSGTDGGPESVAPVACGVGVAGQVEAGTGRVLSAPNLRWEGVPLGSRLEEALGLPVTVANDVRAATWGEWREGAGRGLDDLVVLFVGTGIGGGVVSGGRVLEGAGGEAGELGHTPLVFEGRPCRCGAQGCLEAYAGGWAVAERAAEAAREDREAGARLLRDAGGAPEKITARHVSEAAAEGDALATRLAAETARYLGRGLAGVANVFNPERIVLGGGVIEGQPELVEEAGEQARAQALGPHAEGLEVTPAHLGRPSRSARR